MAIDRTKAINGHSKWVVNSMLDTESNKIPMDNGYFGGYTLITYRRKQAIVFVDDRNADVKVVTGWYDKIFYGGEYERWDGDYRWNTDKPVVVMDKEMFNMTGVHNDKLLLDEWLPELTAKFIHNEQMKEYCLRGKDKDGKDIWVTRNGSVILKDEPTDDVNVVSKYNTDEILNKWIRADKPCAYICGLEFKGARKSYVSKEKAEVLIKTHNRFGGMFNSAEWDMFNGKLTLVFRDYCDSDYD